jgi:hypothetical protein
MPWTSISIYRLDPAVLQYRLDNNFCKRCCQPGNYSKNCAGKANNAPDSFSTKGHGTGCGSSSSSSRGYRGRGTNQPTFPPQQYLTTYSHQTSQAPAYTYPSQQLCFSENLQYITPTSLAPSSTRTPTPSPSPHPQQSTGGSAVNSAKLP